MNGKRIGLLLIALAGLMGASGSVFAGMPPAAPHALTIPASTCTPAHAEDVGKVHLANGYWRFGGTGTHKVTMECPFPGGAIATWNYDGDPMYGPGGFSDARVIFRDEDGAATANHVKVRFIKRYFWGVVLSPWFDSNVDGDTANTNMHIESTASSIGSQTIDLNSLGTFQVQLQRKDTSKKVYFNGIVLDDHPMYYMMLP